MTKIKKTLREKRLKQLIFLIVVVIISVFLNGFFIIKAFIDYNDMSELKNSVASLTEKFSYVEDNYNQYISELEYKNGEFVEKIAQLQKVEDPVYTTGMIAYLTFDDGPSTLTPEILDVLDLYNVKATFFLKGVSIKYMPEILKRMADAGHTIGNHSTTHKYESIYLSLDNLKAEIVDTNRRIKEQTGQDTFAFRFPGGSSNSMFLKYSPLVPINEWFNLIDDLNMEYYDWNVSSLDASGVYKSADEITEAVLKGAKGKNQITVLMHDVPGKRSTLEALPSIIEGLQKMGYVIKPITSNSYPIQHKIAK